MRQADRQHEDDAGGEASGGDGVRMEAHEPSAKYLAGAQFQVSEVGLIPLDWEVIALATRAAIQSGIAKNTNATLRDPISVPYLRVANVQDGYLDLGEVSTIDIERTDLRRYAVLPGDVLMNEGGDLDKLGRGAIWNGQIRSCVHQNHVFVVRCGQGLIPEYLNAWTSSAQARRYFVLAGRQTTNLASINKTSLGELTVAVPPTEREQHEIAAALTDADALIDSLEQLLTKKRQIKQGAMQELLTGKRRLPGCDKPWVNRLFDGIAATSQERVNPSALISPPLCLELEQLESGTGCLSGSAFESQQAATKSVFRRGDVLFGKLRAYLRKYWLAEFDGVCSTEIWVLRPNGDLASSKYLFYTVQRDEFIEAASTAYGTHMPRSDWKIVSEFAVRIPHDPAEQEAIAVVLADMDTDLTALESRLTKARALKQAMAQALLTGRIRLVKPTT